MKSELTQYLAHAQELKDGGELKHVGIKGMRWGYRKGPDGSVKQTGRTKGSADHQKSREIRAKRLRDMSNDELKELNKRLQLERQFRDLNPGVIQRGQTLISRISGAAESARTADRLIQSNPVTNRARTQLLLRTTRAIANARGK